MDISASEEHMNIHSPPYATQVSADQTPLLHTGEGHLRHLLATTDADPFWNILEDTGRSDTLPSHQGISQPSQIDREYQLSHQPAINDANPSLCWY